MGIVFKNNAKTTLASGITDTATSATVADGSVFPSLGAGEYFFCTFDTGTQNEIVKVTARSGNTLTIVRAQDNTTARSFLSGHAAELRVTAGVLENIQENIAAKSANQTIYSTTTASSATSYDIGIDPGVEANASVFLDGVYQHHDTFSFSGSTLTFDAAPVDGTALEVIVDNLINLQSSNLSVDTFTAADVGGNPQTDFTLSDVPGAETNLIVFVDGVFQNQDSYTFSNNTLTMTDGVTADRVVTVYIINPVNIGTPSDGTITSAKLSGDITFPGDITVTGDVAFDSPTFVVDNVNSRVGIGTAAPSTLLDIVGDVKMSADLTVDTSTLHVDSANNRVGIGTTSPEQILHLASNSPIIRLEDTDGTDQYGQIKYNGTLLDIMSRNGASDGVIRFGGHAGGNFTEYARFASSGNLMVGKSSQSGNAALTIKSPAGGNTGIMIVEGDTSDGWGLYSVTSDDSFRITQFTDPGTYSDKVTIDSSGNIGVGTTSPSTYGLFTVNGSGITNHINSTSGAGGINFYEGGSGRFSLRTLNGSAGLAFYDTFNGAERMRISSSGNVGINNTQARYPLNVYNSTNDTETLKLDTNGGSGSVQGRNHLGINHFDSSTTNSSCRISAIEDSTGSWRASLAFSTRSVDSDSVPTERMRITSGGLLNVKSTTVGAGGGQIALQPQDASTADDQDYGFISFRNNSETTLAQIKGISEGSGNNKSHLQFYTSDGSLGMRMRIRDNGTVQVIGALSKGSGSFEIEHPLESKRETHLLRHSFVEAPTCDNIYRGKVTLVNGSASVNLDEASGMSEGTFVLLNKNNQVFTTNESDWDNVKGIITGNTLNISCQNSDSTAEISWLVIGERHDDNIKTSPFTDSDGKLIVEPEKYENET